MKMTNVFSAIGALALLAGSASAATIQLGGGLGGSFGSNAVQAINSQGSWTFSASSGGTSITGLVEAANFGNSLFLTLTDLNFTTNSSAAAVTVTVRLIQDYALGAVLPIATASHQINGNTAGNVVGASINKPSLHEATNLPVVSAGPITGSGNILINAGSGPAVNVGIIGSTYTIDTTYTFVLRTTAGSTGSIILPNSGVDQVSLTVIPLPPATYAGLGSLAVLGFGAAVRRRRLSRSAV